jgi:hypothetical protein
VTQVNLEAMLATGKAPASDDLGRPLLAFLPEETRPDSVRAMAFRS